MKNLSGKIVYFIGNIFRFIIKMGINALLLVIILIRLPFAYESYKAIKWEYEYAFDYGVENIELVCVEANEENTKGFLEYDLEEIYNGRKKVYELTFEIKNWGIYDIESSYGLGIVVRVGKDKYVAHQIAKYYIYTDEYQMLDYEMIPSGQTVKFVIYVLLREDDMPDELHLYMNYYLDGSYITVPVP